MKIKLESYNPDWKIKFSKEKKLLATALFPHNCEIEHIGSTAIEGLDAKPIIDIMIGLDDFLIANQLISKITQLGYEHIDQYETIMPYRKFFIKTELEVRTNHIHMVQKKSDFFIRHLAFRDYLIKNSDVRNSYQQLKRDLSLKEWKDGNEYANAKTEFIRSIEKKALL